MNSYQITSSNIITNNLPPRLNQNSLIDFKRKITSIMVRDLIEVYLRNPYYKRPILIFGPDALYINFDKTFYIIEKEVEKALNMWANLAQTFSINEIAPVKANDVVLNEFYTVVLYHKLLREVLREDRKLTFIGNEARKYTSREFRELARALLSGEGALFELEFLAKVEKKEGENLVLKRFLFVPLEKSLEFL